MGNRAVISFSTRPSAPSIYLHWNGGRASVEGFLGGCLDAGYRCTNDEQADMDQIERAIRPFFARNGECLSIYTQQLSRADKDNWDNGWYIIDETNLQIMERRFRRVADEVNLSKTESIHAEVYRLATKPACRYEHLWEAA